MTTTIHGPKRTFRIYTDTNTFRVVTVRASVTVESLSASSAPNAVSMATMRKAKTEHWDKQHQEGVFDIDRYAVSRKMLDVSKACLTFCRDCEAYDDLLLWYVFF